MSNNCFKNIKETIAYEDQLTNYNIVNFCKNTIVNVYKDLQNYNEEDLQGQLCFNNFTNKWYFNTKT